MYPSVVWEMGDLGSSTGGRRNEAGAPGGGRQSRQSDRHPQ